MNFPKSQFVLSVVAMALCVADEPLPRARESAPSWMEVRDDPASEGWGSEVFSRDVEKQLDRIARWIVDPQPGEGAVIAVHPEFSASVHAPETLSTIFETGSFRVRRPSSATRAPSNENDQDSAGRFISALRAMVDPLAGTNDRHVKFKVVAVKSGADGTVDTRVLFEGSGVSAEGAVQINATLACGWTPSAAGRAKGRDHTALGHVQGQEGFGPHGTPDADLGANAELCRVLGRGRGRGGPADRAG